MPEFAPLHSDPERLRAGAEVYVDVIRGAVRRRLASGDDPNQAMLDALILVESWLNRASSRAQCWSTASASSSTR
jgi:hypothetical protein